MYLTVDVRSAFLYAKLDRPVYVKIPVGFDADRKTHAFKLNKALHGLTDAPALWTQHLTQTLSQLGYQRCKTDWSLFYKRKDALQSFLIFHVDDGFLAASTKSQLDELLDFLGREYQLKVDTEPSSYLKIQLQKFGNFIYLS